MIIGYGLSVWVCVHCIEICTVQTVFTVKLIKKALSVITTMCTARSTLVHIGLAMRCIYIYISHSACIMEIHPRAQNCILCIHHSGLRVST